MPLVSVIIPIYNTEKFLPLCISSVLNQTLTDIEVLLVNDGSTDGSGKICDEYACKDQRIQVIHTLNQGVSHARNQGLETAKGEYIAFMDSDDWIETDMIATLYQLIRTNEAGLATCGYIIENEDGRPIYHINEVKSGKLTQWEAIHSLFNDRHYKYKGNLWDKLYHKEIIDKHHLKFNEHIYYNEDRLFIFQYLSHCQSAAYTTPPYYHYVTRKSSAMNLSQKNYTPKLCTFMDAFDLMTSLSATFPTYILRALSADYIKSSFLFYTQHSREIPFNELWDRMLRIRKNNYIHLPLSLKIKYALYGIRLILRAWLK
jgi:glycosyltransferase family 2